VKNDLDKIEFPKILVVSNNCFSDTNNNGKTLASFFANYPANKVAQLYFSAEIPRVKRYTKHFRISDRDVLKGLVLRKGIVGGPVLPSTEEKKGRVPANNDGFLKLKRSNILRLYREIMWKTGIWRTKALDCWLDDFNPDVVFFVAGDSGFAYDIVSYVKNRYSTRLIVYITDDYILPRRTISPFWWIRRHLIMAKMRSAIQTCDLLYTISPEMREVYKCIFGVDSRIIMNMAASLKDEKIRTNEKTTINMVYTGGLHYNRYKTLGALAKAVRKYNEMPTTTRHVYLRVYSQQGANNEILSLINVENASSFCGALDAEGVKRVLNQSDILVHVEAFDRRSTESTRLSISTKIPEYMSIGKPILAIGPAQVASMKYLEDCAYCVTRLSQLESRLSYLIETDELKEMLSKKALEKYYNNHDPGITREHLVKDILEILGEKPYHCGLS
jgi:glycosyltransferase involved in cell wall biosynthesis